MKCSLVDEEREQIKSALENRIEYLFYALHMNPMCDDIQISIIALDSIGFEEVAERYREQLPEWQYIFDNDKWEDYEE